MRRFRVEHVLLLGWVIGCAPRAAPEREAHEGVTAGVPGFAYIPNRRVVAKIAGEEITEEQLIGDDRELRDLAKRTYKYRIDKLRRMYAERILTVEAKKVGLSLDDFIDQRVLGGKEPPVTDEEFRRFLLDRRIPEGQVDDPTRQRILEFMRPIKRLDLAFLAAVKAGKDVRSEVYFSRPKYVVSVDPGAGPSVGPKEAKVTIVEFADFQCPFCARATETLSEVRRKYGAKVRIVFRQYPLPSHPSARLASEASLCVNEQGVDRFWIFHDLLFENQDKLDKASVVGFAADAGVDPVKFSECLRLGGYSDAVQRDIQYGDSIGVSSTPTFFINGEIIDGAQPFEVFTVIVDEALGNAR